MWILASTASLISFYAGCAIVSLFLIRHSRRQLARQPLKDSRRVDRGVEPMLPAPSAAMPPAELSGWHVQMHDTFRDLAGELDSKMRVLQLLIQMADQSAARLEAALARADGGGSGRAASGIELGNMPGADGPE
jgi:hypothetical protein